jgi:midasin (ATPase involved in ribosome maturation)
MLASLLGVKLIVHNLSQMSDSSDIIGGYKPIELSFLVTQIAERFCEVVPRYLPDADRAIQRIKAIYASKAPEKVVKFVKRVLVEA